MTKARTLANVYKRPLSVFFLPRPPPETPLDIHDFRQLPGIAAGMFSSTCVSSFAGRGSAANWPST